MKGARVLITGATGQVAYAIAKALAKTNQVYAFGRFEKPEARAKIEAIGATPVVGDLAKAELDDVPQYIDYVLNFAVAKSGEPDFDGDIRMNAEGTGLLMAQCHDSQAFIHCSTAGVYAPKPPGEKCQESDPLGDHHRVMMPTYSIAKIATEAVVRTSARLWRMPTTIARLGVPYGDAGGWPWYHLMMMKAGVPIPIHPSAKNRFPLFHEDDYVRSIDALLGFARVPATIVNWAGSEDTTIEEWCRYLGMLTGLEPKFDKTEKALMPLPLDVSLLETKAGKSEVSWRKGLERMVRARNPELLKPEYANA